jgi:hypothetical protein
MRIIVELNTDNASMGTEEEYQLEINRIMQRIGVNLGNGLDYCKIRDLNGNTIGHYETEDIPVFEEASDE